MTTAIQNNCTDRIHEEITSVVKEPKQNQLLTIMQMMEPQMSNAPASSASRYHHAYAGGLATHIWETYNIAMSLVDGLVENSLAYTNSNNYMSTSFFIGDEEFEMLHCLDKESVLTVSILHDIHKVMDPQDLPQYEPNILKSGAVSDKIPYKVNKDCFAYKCLSPEEQEVDQPLRSLAWLFQNDMLEIKNGGVKSLALIAAKVPALLNELTPYEIDAIRYHGGAYETSKFELAGNENPLTVLFHCADMLSSRFGATR